MQFINKYIKGIRSLFCVIVIYSKYPWAIPLKNKGGIKIINSFQKILDESKRKQNKTCVDKGNDSNEMKSMKS